MLMQVSRIAALRLSISRPSRQPEGQVAALAAGTRAGI